MFSATTASASPGKYLRSAWIEGYNQNDYRVKSPSFHVGGNGSCATLQGWWWHDFLI